MTDSVVQVVQAFALRTSPQLTGPHEVAAHVRSSPESFLDLRQAKSSDKSPDFKHKFSRQALWLNSAPQDFVDLVKEWDDDAANKLSKASHVGLLGTMLSNMILI